ncbi:hypothetical protein [Paraburkholderia humisilvae]|nr:hypothetical protein [Paraburkholderia humisilvae]
MNYGSAVTAYEHENQSATPGVPPHVWFGCALAAQQFFVLKRAQVHLFHAFHFAHFKSDVFSMTQWTIEFPIKHDNRFDAGALYL